MSQESMEGVTERRLGLGVDSAGGPVIDPTANVIALNDAANKRQDDLRDAERLLVAAKLDTIRAELDGLREMQRLRAAHASEITQLESKRLDAIRAVDVAAVQTAAERAAQAITALAATTTTNAENLRNALTATAQTIAKQTADTVSGITERLTSLERSSYVGQGRAGVSDPALMQLMEEVRLLRSQQAAGAGKSVGLSAAWGFLVAGVGLVGGLIGIAVAVAK